MSNEFVYIFLDVILFRFFMSFFCEFVCDWKKIIIIKEKHEEEDDLVKSIYI